ncbi:MAG TPA: hypothetical protein VH092_16175, partial [Urbifossiella sp.]|nr:hypothetical protein [Urbifossiella sp.]
MDPTPARREDDLSGVERRLAGWRPVSDTPDAVLFAAGVAVGRGGRSRRAWPVACALLAAQAAGLCGWAFSERAARLAAE